MAWTGAVLPLPFTQLTSAHLLFQSVVGSEAALRLYLHRTSAVTAWLSSIFTTVTSLSLLQRTTKLTL
jgi:hypothetical protein